jgi:hypothetical protein
MQLQIHHILFKLRDQQSLIFCQKRIVLEFLKREPLEWIRLDGEQKSDLRMHFFDSLNMMFCGCNCMFPLIALGIGNENHQRKRMEDDYKNVCKEMKMMEHDEGNTNNTDGQSDSGVRGGYIQSRPLDPYPGQPKRRATYWCAGCRNIVEVDQGGSVTLIWPQECDPERGGCGQSNFFHLLMVDPVVVPDVNQVNVLAAAVRAKAEAMRLGVAA